MGKLGKLFKVSAKVVQAVGIGLGTAAMTNPEALRGVLPPEQVAALAGAAAIVNAFLPSITGRDKPKK